MRTKLKIGSALGLAASVAALSGSLAGAADSDLEAKLSGARSEAQLITERITSQAARISSLQERATDAAARERELQAQLEQATARSAQLNDELVAVKAELSEVRDRYKRAVGVLSNRLVAIYKGSDPDELSVLLEADGFQQLSTHLEYVRALTEADEQIAERVAELRDEVEAHRDRVAGLKAEIDEQARELESARAEIAAIRAEATERAAELADAKAQAESALAELREKISGWELEVRKQAAAELEGAGEAFLGGPYAIPTYIVMCESGGNYRALNRSSMAGGAYQIIPSTWRAYGGQGPYAHLASKAEQDRVAAIIWREDGPGAWACA